MAHLQRFNLDSILDTGIEIGRGSYSTVKKFDLQGRVCAGKEIHRLLYESATPEMRTGMLRRFEEECELLSRLHHRNIVQFLGVYLRANSGLPSLVMEYLPNGNLSGHLESHGVFPAKTSLSILQDVALGLRYLHEHTPPIIHRDLTANNVLLTTNMSAKISDLGMAKILDMSPAHAARMTQTYCPGAAAYMPPETMVAHPKYTSKIDIFSMGVLIVHVLSGEWPIPSEATAMQDPDNPDKLVVVTEFERRHSSMKKIEHDHPLLGLVQQCLRNIPDRRPDAGEVVHHLRESDLLAGLQHLRLDGIHDTGVEIGRGAYAVVKELEFQERKCAGKEIHSLLYEEATPREQAIMLQRFKEECELLGSLNHPNIVQFLGVCLGKSSGLPLLVMEYLPNGNLSGHLESHGVFPAKTSLSILQDVALGLRYLHEHTPPIIHRDLTANNVLLTTNMSAKISDLGMAKILDMSPAHAARMTRTEVPGAPAYMPPETMVAHPKYTSKIDIFSMGVLIVHVLSGEWPIPNEATFTGDPHNPDELIVVTEFERRRSSIEKIKDGRPLLDLIKQCLNNIPDRRPDAGDVVHQLNKDYSVEQQRTFFLEDTIQFGYHLICSDHMRISKNRRSVEKIDPGQCYAHGVTYGEKPLRGTVEFEVELSSYGTAWSGTLKLGVMRIKEGHDFDEIPRYSPEGNDYCVWSADRVHNRLSYNDEAFYLEKPYGNVNLDDLRVGDRVGLRLTSEGVLSFFVNGDCQGTAAEDVYRKGSWVFVVIDHYANCKATRITRAVMDCDSSEQHMQLKNTCSTM